MSDLSAQGANSVIETFPMKTRRHGTSKPRSLDVLSDNKTFKVSKNGDGKVSRRPSYQGRTVCQSCAKKSSNTSRALIHNFRRVSLPLRGKYANIDHSKTNGSHVVSVKALIKQGNTGGALGRNSNHRRASNEEALHPCREPDKRWKNKADYFVAVLTYLLGVGNVILFPQLCFKHGGGAFFIPYFIMLLLEGIPLVCLEMAIGQRLGKSSLVEAWKDLTPNLHGIGMAAVMQSLVTCFYYNYIVAWFLHYFFHSLRSTLLWETCPSSNNNRSETMNVECEKSGPAEYYWYRKTLDVADDINHSTGINMYLYLFVVIAWTVSFVLSMRGLRRISKVLLILLVLIITNLVTFFFVGVHLDGWAEGLARLFIPEWERLLDPVVWMDAAGQIFYSLGIGFGALIILSGPNQPNNNCYEDALICALGNCGMSVCASIVMFSFFGFKAYYKTNKCLEMIGKASANGSTSKLGNVSCSKREIFDQIPPGLSLGFAGLSETFTEISLSPLCSSLFYFLLFCLGSSSMLGTLEVLITTFKEIGLFPQKWRNELLYGGVCLAFCISNLIFVQSTGFYLLEIISGASSLPLLLTGLAECVGVAYIYGMDKFSKDLALVTGKPVKKRWKICWKYISPLIILGVIIGGMVQMIRNIVYGKFSYTAWDKSKGKIKYQPYPLWGYVFHVAFLLLPCVCIAYPFLKNNNRSRNRTDSDHTLCTIVGEPSKHCYGGGSRSYQVSLSSDPPYGNGHVNPFVDED